MRQDVDITNFTSGQLSLRMQGRVDLAKYFNGAETLLNMVVMPQGGATRRPGTLYVADATEQAITHPPRLKRFTYSTLQSYMLEFSDHNVRVYKDDGVVMNGGVPVDIAVPYAIADVKALKFAQSADTLFICHGNYPAATLTRSSHVNWTYAPIQFRDGPYGDINSTGTTLSASATTGNITVTASGVAGINNGAGFLPSDVGRLIRMRSDRPPPPNAVTIATGTGVATAGSHIFAVSFVTATNETGVSPASSPITIDATHLQAEITIPIGPAYVIARNVYASKAGAPGTVYLISSPNVVKDNITTKYIFNTADASFLSSPGGPAANVGFWGWVLITAYVSPTQVQGTVQPAVIGTANGAAGALDGTAPTTAWQMGSYGAALGYPFACGFWQQRLFFGGSKAAPNRVVGSAVGDFTNMAPSEQDGIVTDASAVDWTLDDDEVNAIQWLSPAGSADAMQLAIGTTGGEHIVQAATNSQALTPTSIQAYRETIYGSAADIQPLRIGKALLFSDAAERKLREWSFLWQVNGYAARDLIQLSEDMTRSGGGAPPTFSGFGGMCYQAAPYQVVWGWRNDGALLSFAYDREQDVFAPSIHRLGGEYYGGIPIVEAADTMASQDGTYDELWLSVLRTVGGTPKRFIEVLTRYFDGGDPDNAFFVDAGLQTIPATPAATISISGLTNKALPADVLPSWLGTGTFATDADVFTPSSVDSIIRVNGGKAVVTAYTDARHVQAQVLRRLLSLAPAASGRWSVSPQFSSVSGLTHLNGASVAILGDGSVRLNATVTGGAVPVSDTASLVIAGLPSMPGIVSLPFEPQRAAAALSAGKVKRIDSVWVRFHETLGGSFGVRTMDDYTGLLIEDLEPIESRSAADPMDNAPPLFTGIKRLRPRGGFDNEGQVVITQPEPLPLTVLAIFVRGDTGEMPGS